MPGLAFPLSRRVWPLLVLLNLLMERFTGLALCRGILLLRFENGRRLRSAYGGLLRLVPLVRHSAAKAESAARIANWISY